MCDADGGIGCVDVLASRPGSAESVDAQIRSLDIYTFDALSFCEDGDSAGRGVDAALRFGFRDPLYPVGSGFKFEF